MELALFLKFIEKVGADNILCFVFDLGDKIIYRNEQKFDISQVDQDIECIVYETTDTNDIPVKTYHPISKLHHIFTVDDVNEKGNVNIRYLI